MKYQNHDLLSDAVTLLVGGSITILDEGNVNFNSGQVEPTQDEVTAEITRLQAELTATQYQKDRATSYPSVGDQLDMMMKDMRDGTTTHQTACEAVKSKFPKP